MRPSPRNIIRILSIPLLFLCIYLSLLLLGHFIDIPNQETLLIKAEEFVLTYGLLFIFIASLIEGMLLVGNYVPGGSVIFLGVITSVGNIPRAILVVTIVCIAFFISYTVNYLLGKYGWYTLLTRWGFQSSIDSMQKKLSRHVFTAIISSYWMPNIAALCSTAAGIMKIPLRTFLTQSLIAIICWNTFWGVFVYITGDALLTLNIWYVLLIFSVWCVLILYKVFVWDRHNKVIEETTQDDILSR